MTESVSESSATILSNSTMKKSIKILHVDDDPSFLKVAKQCLEMQGEIEVDTVSSVNEASEKLKKTDYDVIVCDYQIPGKDGLEFLKELRGKGNTIPFIILTGKSREEIAVKALNLGADGYFSKHGEPATVYGELAHGIRAAMINKRAEMQLRRNALILENIADSVIVTDLEGRITSWNNGASRIFGFSAEEMLGENIAKTSKPKEREQVASAQLEQVRKGVLFSGEWEGVKKDGEPVWLMLTTKLLKNSQGENVGMIGVGKDITEHKKTEEELRESEEKLRNVFAASPDAITVSDLNGNIVECNKTTVALHGYESKEELIGKNSLELIAKKDHKRAMEGLKETLEHGSAKSLEYTFLTKDGREFPAELSASVVMDASGKPEYFMAITKDITERKQMEKQLKKSEEKWRSLAENAPNIIVIVDRVGTIQFINRTVVNARPEEIVGKRIYDFIDPEHHNVVKKTIEQVFQTGEGSRYGISGVGPKGSVAWYETHVGPIKHDGQTVTVTLITTDFTERQKMEQELRIKEAAVASSIDAVAFADLEGKLTYVNSSFLEMWGYANDKEVLGRPAAEFWLAEEKAVEIMKALNDGQGWGGELTAKKKDGSTFEAQLSASLVKDETGKPLCMMASFIDISERRKAGQSLKESEEKYRSLVELAPDGILAVNVEGIVTSANRSFLTLVGYDSEEGIVGKPFTELMTIRMEDIPKFQEMFMSLIKGESLSIVEFLYVRRDGTSRWAEVHPALLIKDGNPVGVQVIMRDVTERKNAEKHLNEMNKKLEATNEKLHVVGGLTRHDVRNKLSAVTGNAYLLRQKLVGDAKALEQLKDMEAAVRLVEKIFEFATIYEKLGTEELVNIDVGKTVDGAVSLFSDLKGVKIVNECDGLTVLADSLLRQLFYNLVDNSLKYGEKLSRIRVYYEEKNGGHVDVIYVDDGVGIPHAAKPKLFDEGYTTGKGSGYGLYLVKKMMEVYGWTISETGTHGKGAKFIISIPRTNRDGKENYRLN
jgi:PAS domain S-box-containing protein